MKKIIKIVFMVMISLVTMSQEVSKEIPKEVKSSSQKWSLTSENELSYDGKPYTGKVILDNKGGKGYLNLKDGHLEGYSYMESQVFETSFNVVNRKFDGEYMFMEKINGVRQGSIISFNKGNIEKLKGNGKTIVYDLIFDSQGKVNGKMVKGKEELIVKDGVTKNKGLTLLVNLNDEKNGVNLKIFNSSNNLMQEANMIDKTDSDELEGILFKSFFKTAK